MQVGLTWQVMIKLSVSGLVAGIGLLELCWNRAILRQLLTIPACLVGGILVLGLPAAVASSIPAALPAVIINAAYLVFVAVCLERIGLDRFLQALLLGIAVGLTSAWLLYFFVPSYGVFPELLNDGLIVRRLGGIGHPNSVARSAMLALLISSYLLGQTKLPKTIGIPLLLLEIASVLFAKSRTVMLGGFFAIGVMIFERLKSRAGLALATSFAAFGFVGLLALAAVGQEDRVVGKLIESVSKSGDAEELTSGTGRIDIWNRAVELIAERPLTGHGFGAAVVLMVDHSQSTHNSILHASMIAGVGGGILMLAIYAWMVWVFLSTNNAFIRGAITFLMISGLMEETILETFPGPATMIWLACCLYPVSTSPMTSRNGDNEVRKA
jgi:O-antigen ligase